jgi:hypothetical protein
MLKDAFISHAAEDATLADAITGHLEHDGLACWIAPRDVRPGCEYASEIIDGIESCAVFVLVLSAAANLSPFVKREVERAASKGKPILTFRAAPVAPARSLELFVSSAHWIDAWEAPLAPHLAQLAASVRNAVGGPPAAAPDEARAPRPAARPLARQGVASAAAIVAAVVALYFARHPAPTAPLAQADRPAENAAPTPKAPPAPPAPVAATVPVAAPAAASAAAPADPCPIRLSINRDLPTPYTCTCGADAMRLGSVWGSNDYTDDSGLCQAALHAGVVAPGGGAVTVVRGPGRPLYIGSRRNNVETHDYGDYDHSIRFVGAAAPAPGPEPCPVRLSVNPNLPTPFTCTCDAGAVRAGTVWGTDTYTGDSGLCQAALHAGAIPPGGGRLTVVRGPGRPLYVGSSRNNVQSHDYGDYSPSIRFQPGGPAR